MIQTKDIAVLSTGKLYRAIDGSWQVTPIDADRTLSNLCALAADNQIASLWVLDRDIDASPAYFGESSTDWNLWPNWNWPLHEEPALDTTHQLVSVSGYRRGGGQKQFSVMFPFNSRSPWRFIKSKKASPPQPHHVLLTLLYLYKALGIMPTANPSSVGMKLLKKHNENHPQWLSAPALYQVDIDWTDAASDVIWSRPLNEQEQGYKYFHKVDKNGAYLRSAVAEKFGVGDPVHVTECAPDEKRPGVWCIVDENDELEGLPPLREEHDSNWVTTPVLQLLRKMGSRVLVLEGWVWPESHQVFKKWGEHLWSVREQFKAVKEFKSEIACKMAGDAVKQIATATVGLTSYGGFDGEKTYKNRPDWKAHVVSATRATMFYNMVKLKNERGITPVIVYMDALYIASNDADPFVACAPLLDRKRLTSLGGYKHEWTLELDANLIGILDSDEPESVKLMHCNKLVRSKLPV